MKLTCFSALFLSLALLGGLSTATSATTTQADTPAIPAPAAPPKAPAKADAPLAIEMHWSAAEPVLVGGEVQRPTENYIVDLPLLPAQVEAAIAQNSVEPLRESLQAAYRKIEERKPRDIRFKQNAAGEWVGQAQTGWTVVQAETEQSLLEALKAKRLQSTVFLKLTAPTRHVRWASEQKIRYLGSGISSFAGSPDFRVTNIRTGSSRIDNVWLKAGEEFNFNRMIGPITQAAGFAPGYVIKGNALVTEDGGGLCQVSTTVFRAALNVGLPIAERHAHSYQVGYYGDPGYDAAVYAPLKNLRWINDTGGPLMIQVDWNRVEGILMVSLFGQQDGRKVTLSEPVQSNVRLPGTPRYVADPALKAGQTRRMDMPMPGSQVTLQRTVRYANGRQEVYQLRSNYVPWAGSMAVPVGDPRLKAGSR